jgi:hypothetical protein
MKTSQTKSRKDRQSQDKKDTLPYFIGEVTADALGFLSCKQATKQDKTKTETKTTTTAKTKGMTKRKIKTDTNIKIKTETKTKQRQ